MAEPGRLVVVEGIDGSGKQTLTGALTAELTGRGLRVTRCAFPRYDADDHAALVRRALYGELPAVGGSVPAMSMLYALDRRAAAPALQRARAEHDVVLVDRFTASNAAYGAARLGEAADGAFAVWVGAVEDELGVPRPDHQLLLDVPRAVAGRRAAERARADPARARDDYESDDDLQQRAGEIYRELAAAGWRSPWTVLDGAARPDVAALADRLISPTSGDGMLAR